MSKSVKKFAIPYNGGNVDEYLEIISKYRNNIEEIYLNVPSLIHNNKNTLYRNFNNVEFVIQYEKNVYEFLEKSKGEFKRLLTINSPFYTMTTDEKHLWVETKLKPLCLFYSIEGIIIADFELAKIIHQRFPILEIQTSCNTFSFLPETYKIWHDECGVIVFNPPRDILRHKDELIKIKNIVNEFGGKLKCLVSDTCITGCPAMMNHVSYVSIKRRDYDFQNFYCTKNFKFSNFLKSNWVLPKHLNYLQEFVDIFKITGRDIDNKDLEIKLFCWINEVEELDDILGNLTNGVIFNKIKSFGDIKIRSKDIPEKIFNCDHNCSKCNICEKVMEKILKRCYNDGKIDKKYTLDDLLELL